MAKKEKKPYAFEKVAGYVGIYTRKTTHTTKTGRKVSDLSFYARYTLDGKKRFDFVGKASDRPEAMTAAQAANIRAKLTAGVPVSLPNPRSKAKKRSQGASGLHNTGDSSADDNDIDPENRPPEYWTFSRLWKQYVKHNGGAENFSNYKTDRGYFNNHIKPYFGDLHPADITPLKIDNLRNILREKKGQVPGAADGLAAARAAKARADDMLGKARTEKTRAKHEKRAKEAADRVAYYRQQIKAKARPLAPATIEKAVEIVRRLANFGKDNDLCPGPRKRILVKPVDNEKTEDLTPAQIAALLKACDASANQEAADMIRLALATGLRRGSLFQLAWKNIDFHTGILTVKAIEPRKRHSKSGRQIKLKMSPEVIRILEGRKAVADLKTSPYVFPGQDGAMRVDEGLGVRRICRAAGIPDDFRPLHGLRHTYASHIANSGQVDLYQLGKLLGHSPNSPGITQRYAHIRDEALQRATNIMSDIIQAARAEGEDQQETEEKVKVIPFKGSQKRRQRPEVKPARRRVKTK